MFHIFLCLHKLEMFFCSSKKIRNVLFILILIITCSTESTLNFIENKNASLQTHVISDLLFQYKCINWNISLKIIGDSQRNVHIHFELFEQYVKCFSAYEVYLYRLWSGHSKLCDLSHATREKRLKAHVKKGPDKQSGSAIFKEVRHGNYCALITPCLKNYCDSSWSLHSVVISVCEKYLSDATYLKQPDSVEEKNMSSIEISSIVFIIIFTFGGAIYWCLNSIIRRRKVTEYEIKIKIEEPLFSKDVIDVFILYSEENDLREKVLLLKDFLVNEADFNVILMEDAVHEIVIDPITWVNKTLRYKCSNLGGHCDSNKRFIIVQSESVLHYIKCKMDTMDKIGTEPEKWLASSTDDNLQDMCLHFALDSICMDWVKGLRDYCHLFIISFNDALCYNDEQILISHGVRYTIPEHLVNLCVDMNIAYENTSVKEQLHKKFNNHPIKNLHC